MTLSSRIMTSRQTGPSHKMKQKNEENLLKLTVDKFCKKLLRFLNNRIVYFWIN